jgi:hypothetical protein
MLAHSSGTCQEPTIRPGRADYPTQHLRGSQHGVSEGHSASPRHTRRNQMPHYRQKASAGVVATERSISCEGAFGLRDPNGDSAMGFPSRSRHGIIGRHSGPSPRLEPVRIILDRSFRDRSKLMTGKIFEPLVQAASWGLAVVLVLIAMLLTVRAFADEPSPTSGQQRPSQQDRCQFLMDKVSGIILS